jgi:hypothetical protein
MPTFTQFCQFASVVRTVDDLLLCGTPVRLECIACELQSWNQDLKRRLVRHMCQLSSDEPTMTIVDEVLKRETSLFLCKCTPVPMSWPEVASHVDHLPEPFCCISAWAATMLPLFKRTITADIVDTSAYSFALSCNYEHPGASPDTRVSFATWVCSLIFFDDSSTQSDIAA